MWVAIHKCMKAMLGISLYSYFYVKLAKMPCLSYYLLCSHFNNIGDEEGGTGFAWECQVVRGQKGQGGGAGGPNNV
jgi:hypothetical protein